MPRETEFVFHVSSAPAARRAVSILLPQALVDGWEQAHGLRLAEAERYAVAKLELFRRFDECDTAGDMLPRVSVTAAALDVHLAKLGIP